MFWFCLQKFEGDPLISLEAAAMNVPIIATDIVGFRQQIQQGQFGILYQQISEEPDARAIKDILVKCQDQLKACALRGREFVKRTRDVRQKEMVYKKVLSSMLKPPNDSSPDKTWGISSKSFFF